MGDDQRQDQRVARAVPIRLNFEGADAFLSAYSENVSLGGIFVPTEALVPVGTQVQLTIELAPGKGFQARAEVAWQRPAGELNAAGVGLRFTQTTPQVAKWLQTSVSAQPEVVEAEPAYRAEHQLRPVKAGSALNEAALDVGALGLDTGDGPIIGIDLGTSNSALCVFLDGRATMIDLTPDAGSASTSVPSVVAFQDGGRTVVGHPAMEGIQNNARRTIYGSKRFIGRKYDHPEVQQMLSRYPYKVVPGSAGRAAVDIDGRQVNLGSISAKILGYIKDAAEKKLGTMVTRAIITVPAYYNQNQRFAVTQAGRLAGLTVERIINEPTAAAIAYGLTHATPKNIIVYDLGGGTFDVSVMAVGQKVLVVRSTAGDTFLGGEDFDSLIMDHVAKRFREESGKSLSRNSAAMSRLKVAAEKAKCRLSLKDRTMVTMREAMLSDGNTTRLEMEVTRREIDVLVEPLIARTLKICDVALGEAGLSRHAVDEVLLVGAQTLMPSVRQRVAEHFGKKPRSDLRPDEVVAMGAALLSVMNEADAAGLQDVLPISIGIGLPGGKYKQLIARNTPVPHRVSHQMQFFARDMGTIAVEIFQGEDANSVRNEHLGKIDLSEIQGGSQDPVPVRLDLILSPDCLLKVRVANLATGKEADILLGTREL